MARLMLDGPHPLEFGTISELIRDNASGVYVLGYSGTEGNFYIDRVGRADSNMNESLLQLIGSAPMFKFEYALSAREAFDWECAIFHEFHPPGNFLHPSRPTGTDWQCRYCSHSRLSGSMNYV